MHELKNPRLPGFQQNTRIPLCAQKRRCFRGPYPVDSTLHEEVLGPRPDAGGFVVLLKVNKVPRVGWAVVARAPPACRPLGLRGFGGSEHSVWIPVVFDKFLARLISHRNF
jgi:hypothetical protein